jgi:hypothetical protein
VIALVVLSSVVSGQESASAGQPSPCLRFAFGVWNPLLNWEEAGHAGKADANGQAVRRLRDSIFLQQPGSTAADGMIWDEKSGGRRVVVFPAWWPAGIVVQFDSMTVSGDTLRGIAEAMVADGAAARPTAKVRALRVACGQSR